MKNIQNPLDFQLENTEDLTAELINQSPDFSVVDYSVLAAMIVSLSLLLSLKTNMGLAVLGLCVGYFFQELAANELINFLGLQTFSDGFSAASTINIAIVFAPAVLIITAFRNYSKGGALKQLIPALAFVGLAAVILIDLLPVATSRTLLADSFVFDWLLNSKLWVALMAVSLALADMIFLKESNDLDGRSRKRLRR